VRRQIWISIARTCPFYSVLETAREVSLTNVQPTRDREPAVDHVYLKPGRDTVEQFAGGNRLTWERLSCSEHRQGSIVPPSSGRNAVHVLTLPQQRPRPAVEQFAC
jgi:hypothetical protein